MFKYFRNGGEFSRGPAQMALSEVEDRLTESLNKYDSNYDYYAHELEPFVSYSTSSYYEKLYVYINVDISGVENVTCRHDKSRINFLLSEAKKSAMNKARDAVNNFIKSGRCDVEKIKIEVEMKFV